MKTDYPSSRGRRSSPELFTHNLALIHMKQARQSSRFPRSNSLLVCCAFVALMGITILSMGNIAHAQGTLVTNVDQPYTWYDDHGQKGLDLPDELDVITDQFLEIEVDIPPWVTVVGAWVAAVAGGTYGGIGGAAIGAIIGAAVVELSEELTDLQLESAQEALREFLEDVEDTYDTHTIPYGIWNGTLAQEFTTGSNGYGYDLSSVGIYGRFYPDNAINFPASISIWSGPYTPVAHLYTLPFAKSVNDGSHGLRLVYQPESPATLEPDTRYVIFVGHVENSRVVVTSSGNEDAGASPGWSIKNDLAEKSGDLWRLVTPEDAGRKVFPADALPVLRIGIEGSLLDSNTIIVSLTNVGEGQFKATATTSAPSDIILPIAVINGTIESGATTVTIPAGSTESDVINVSRIPGTTFPVSVDIGNLPSPPTGYSLFKSPSRLPLQVLEGLSGSITPVSERTPQVRDAIVAAVRGINSANDVTEAHLAAITTLRVNAPPNQAVRPIIFRIGDFSGLTTLTNLEMERWSGVSLPDGIFDGLNALERVSLYSSGLRSIPNSVLGLTSLKSLNIGYHGITSIPAGVFDQLTQLNTLILDAAAYGNTFTSLPDGVFDKLTSLTYLNLDQNKITSLPDGVFDQLTSLESLSMARIHSLSSLPDGVFDQLTSLTSLSLQSLKPASLPDGIFSELSSLTFLDLSSGRLTSLPAGIFSGLSSLTSLYLRRNAVDPLPLTVSLETVGEGQFKAVAPTGAPFDIVLPFNVRNGSISGGANILTIPTGSLESASLTVTRTPGTTAAVTVDIGTLLGLPTDVNQYGTRIHQGYTLVKSDDLPLVVINRLESGITPVSERTLQVRDAIVAAVPGINSADDVTEAHLAAITVLNLNGRNITALKVGDFDGLTSLEELRLYNNQLTTLPEDIFDGLTALTTLRLYGNQLSTLPEDIFDELIALTTLQLGLNRFTTLPSSIFDGLTKLTDLRMIGNQFITLPDSIFDGLTALTTLYLGDNAVNPLPLTVSLGKVGEDGFKATAPTGAPFAIVLPISVTNGSISGGATTLTIPAGSVESEPLTITRTLGATYATTVNIGTLPSLPANHSGYTLVKSADLPLNVTEGDIADIFAFTMTVVRIPRTDWIGFHQAGPGSTRPPYGSLSRQTFNFKGITYTVHQLYYSTDSSTGRKNLNFQTSPLFPRGFELYLDSQQFNSAACNDFDGALWFGRGTNRWYNVDLNWSTGQTVRVRVVETTPIPPGPPTNLTATTDFKNVTLTWEPHVNTDPTSLRVEYYELRISDDGGTTWAPDWEDIEYSGSGEENRSSVTIGSFGRVYYTFSNDMEYTFEIRAKGGDGYGDAARVTLIMNGITPISERTSQVRDAIVAAVPGVNSANDVTEAHLAAITSLYLDRDNITTLKAGDFDGLTALTTLNLAENQLSTLPADIFDALTELRELQLQNNRLSTLPVGIFEGPSVLANLYLSDNQLTTLPAGIFDKQTVLRILNLEGNQLSTLPEGIFDKLTELNYLTLADNRLTTLPAGIFDGPSALYDISLDGNRFTTLPMGIFKMKASFLTLRGLYLEDNAVDPLPLTVSLEKVADSQFKAVAPAGATFDFVLQISVANGTINGGTTTLTIPKGSAESTPLTVTRTPGTTAAVSVDIRYPLPELPSNHSGYELVKSPDLPLEVISVVAVTTPDTGKVETAVNIPDPNLRTKIETALGNASGAPISAAEMATLTSLTAQDASISNLTGLETATNLTTLKLGNNTISDISALAGLTNLTELQLWDNSISNISAVAELTNLTHLYLWGNAISDISAVARLTNLTHLRLGENSISNISALAGLTNLTFLSVKENSISDISAVAGLTNLTELVIGNNAITNISAVAKLTNLVWLDAPNNSISDISAVANLTNLTSLMLTGNTISDISALTGLTKLIELYLEENSISDLSPLVTNTGLGNNTEIYVTGNPLSYPSIYTHIPALQARGAYVDFDNRVATALVKISGDTQQGTPGAALAQPFVVEVRDTDSVAFAGVPMTFAITAGGGTLSVTSIMTSANGRAQSTLTLGSSAGTNTVRASVQGISQTETFTAVATTTNSAPTFTEGTSTTRTIAENTAAGVNIGAAIAATDADNDTLTYTLGGTDASSFSIVSSSGQLQTQAALDYEIKSSYSVTVSVSDDNGGSDSITVTINVTDINEQQTEQADVTTYEVDDEIPLPSGFNTPRLTMGPGRSLTADNGTYTCVSEDNCIIQNGQVTQGTIEVTTVAANTAPMFTDGTSTARSIAENTAAGVSIGTAITATDTNNDILTYTLSGTEASAFSIDSSTGQLKTKSALDYETKRSYTVTITVSDGSLTDTITVTINITDVAETPVVPTLNLLSDRTPEVRDAIVAAVPGVNSANDVTEAHLAAITRLDLENKNISSLKDGDFDGMTALFELRLQNNRLQTLPANIFSDLSSLRTLYLNNNRLSSLPSTVFSGLSSLSNLYMNNNQLTSLPALVFSGLTSLRQINMHTNLLTTLPVNVFSGLSSLNQISINNNRLTSLPENVFSGRTGLIYLYLDGNRLTSLPANLFSGLSALEQLKFNNNRLSTLPAGLFRGLSSLTWLLVQGNTVNPLPFTVSLEKVGTNQFKATAPVGAPFAMTIPIPVVNGSISGGATTLTIPAGDVESAPLTVTRRLGTTGAVTVDIGTLPGLPTQHQGYELVKSSNLPLTVINVLSNSAPVFTDGTSATRTIAENTASGVNIGSPVSATDANNDTLTYSLSGTDAASFDIDTTNGQLQTQAALDYETKSSYTVTVTVSDGDLTDTITVTVNITDIDELPTDAGVCKVGDILAPGESCTYPGTDATFSVLDNGQAQWNIPDLPAWLEWINQTSISGSLSISTTINGETYHFVAEELSSGSWEIKEIGDSGTQQPDPSEQPQPPVTESDPPTLSASTAAPLTEATLHEGVVTLTLNDGTYESSNSRIRNAVTASTDIRGVTVNNFDIDRMSDTQVTVELTFDGTDFDTNSTITFTVGAGAIADYDGTALTAQIPVSANTESVVATTAAPLTEDTLDGSVVTLTLSGRTYESSGVRIRNAVTVSGISGVTVGTFDIDRVSDTQVTFELTFDGTDFDTNSTLTFTVGTGAIAGYDGAALTAQVSVSATTEAPEDTGGQTPQQPGDVGGAPTLTTSTTAPLTETTLDESVVTLTLSGGTYHTILGVLSQRVTVSGIDGVIVQVFNIERVSDTEVTVELTFDDTDFDTNSTLTFTVGAGAIANYDGTALTAQVPVTANTESVVASTTSPLTEDTLDGSVVTLTLSGRTYESSGVRIRNAVTVSGISGVTVGTFDIDRVSDTQVTVELTFDGNISTDSTLTFTVGPGAIAGYNGPALTTQVSVTATTNTAPTFTAGSTTTRTVAENTVANVNVGSAVAATDANNDTLTYTLGGTDANVFSIESTTGQLKTRAALDYETKRTYTVTITVSDGNGGSDSITVTITVTNVVENRAPVFTDGVSTTRSVTENTAARQNIGRTISATDPNGDTLRYNLSGTEAASFRIDGTTGQLRTWAALDYETKRTYTVTVTVSDGSLTDTITVTINVTDVDDTPTLNVSTAVPLTEATLHGSVVTLTLSKKTYHTNWNFVSQNVEVSGITGVTFRRHNVVRVSDTKVTVELEFNGNISTNSTLTFTVGAEAIAGYTGPALTAQVPVSAGTESIVASTAQPLTEATLDESVVTLTLSGRTYERSIFTIRDAVTVSGITGVTVGTSDIDRVSDTQVTVELTFNGNINTDSTLTFTVGADAIVGGYNGSALTSQVSVSAGDPPEQPQQPEGVGGTPTLSASTAAPLTEATLDESVITLTLSGRTYEQSNARIRTAVTISGIAGVTVRGTDIDRVSDTQVTVELTFDRNINTDGTLTFTVGAGAIADYTGSALTAQIPVTAVAESVVATTAAPLTEATLDESVVTLTLNSRSYESSRFTIRDAVTVSGIAGVTVGTFGVDRVSDTTITVELTFDGNINTNGTLTFTVGADAIARYNGPALTAQVSVSAGDTSVVQDPDPPEQPITTGGEGETPTLSASTVAPLTEATLHEGVVTLRLSGGTYERSTFTIRDAVTVSGIASVTVGTFGVDRVSDTEVTIELEFDGNINTNATLIFTVGAAAIVDYTGPALTAQIPVTANTESVVATTVSPLTEATLDESVVTLALNGANYERSIFDIRGAVTVSAGITGVTVGTFGVRRVSDTEVTVELEFDGSDFDTTSTLTFTVGAEAIAGYNGPALTTQISVTAVAESVVASTAAPLTEDTLDGSVVTLTLSGRTYERSSFRIRDAVTVSGISGVTVGTFDIDRVSDTEVTVELTFSGDFDTNSTLTFTVGAGAIAGYDGAALTAQVPVTATVQVLRAPSGISLMHVPLQVTAVDGVAQTIESVGDLYNALGGMNTVNLLITHNPKTQEWHSYLGDSSRGTSADTVLTDNQGIIADMKTPVSLQLDGNALGRNGSSVITLRPGTNLVAMRR